MSWRLQLLLVTLLLSGALAFGQQGNTVCSDTHSTNALIPFQAICMPIQTRKNDDNCVITVIPCRS